MSRQNTLIDTTLADHQALNTSETCESLPTSNLRARLQVAIQDMAGVENGAMHLVLIKLIKFKKQDESKILNSRTFNRFQVNFFQ